MSNEKEPEDGSLKAAEEHLKKAEGELEHAEHDVEEAIEEVRQAQHHRPEFEVIVLYDGVKKKFEVKQEELVKKLLEQAIQAFGPIPTPNHLLALFNEAGEELKDEQTLQQAGVKPHDLFLLRPSKVKGGDR